MNNQIDCIPRMCGDEAAVCLHRARDTREESGIESRELEIGIGEVRDDSRRVRAFGRKDWNNC